MSEFCTPQLELLTRLMSSLMLCLKRDQQVVSGASKEHQATFQLNVLSVGRYELVPGMSSNPT